ncbi:hypothetical protein EBME_0321 [bacterium endosymbiont of Mortierella elongata FMR23-6]|nr:hypothetical protein EBME_0321 [bacterium endosymbiont of Mortierella elongata FMR23-6]
MNWAGRRLCRKSSPSPTQLKRFSPLLIVAISPPAKQTKYRIPKQKTGAEAEG